MWAEGVLGRTVGGCLSRTKLAGAVGGSHRAQFVAFQQRELVGMGRAGSRGLSAHWALLCAQKLPAYGRCIRNHQRKKKNFHLKKKKVLEKYLTLSGSSFFRLKRASRHLWAVRLWNVCHPPSLAVFMMNQRWWLIHQVPSAPNALAYLDLSWGEEAGLQVFLQQIICSVSWFHPWPDYTTVVCFFLTPYYGLDTMQLPPF